ncbi:D-alanine--D-alanine ligase [Virgibacillus senegalensis]|uniref:D-alanine--D-alanine ligase n=1 Tax=Virgibacillus senegalensis TaxID=1499679 RepID=UPI00069D7424|nr:D-alanine--D-alanine ligase [Virgibacillus senegalensis]
MKIAVLYGGTSGEREVSLSTGKGIIQALKKNGHEVTGIDFHPERLDELMKLEADLVFIGLHGKYGEDGRIQGLLDIRNIPYVGSGVLASALAMDKAKAKQIFEKNQLPVAKGIAIPTKRHTHQEIMNLIQEQFTPPYVVKPNQEGSTLGLTIVKNEEQLPEAVKNAVQSDDTLLVEEFVSGREFTVAVIGAQGEEEALPVIEIIPKNDYYDFDSKYKPGGSEHIVPAHISDSLTEEMQSIAVRAHQLLGCDVYSRVDFIVTEANRPVVLEVNTLPGMTPTSLFPDAARVIGLSYEQMVERFVTLSLKNKQ